jgi:very-short-patch-repair endonuclease
VNEAALSDILRRQHQVISRQQALSCGMTSDGVLHKVRPGGPWQLLLPGTYLAQTGRASADHKDMAAQLYAGPASVITGQAALRGLNVSRREPAVVDVLIPATQQRRSASFAAIHRTIRMPEITMSGGGVRYAIVPRAVADAARQSTSLADVRAIVASAVQRDRCPLSMLTDELAAGGRNNSGLLRIAVGEVVGGIRSIAEGEFRELIMRAKLPMPKFNEQLYRRDGTLIAIADAWWPQARLVAEVDSREWHLSPADWAKTMRRHNDLTQHGIHVLHFTPGQIRHDPRSVVATIAAALQQRGTATAVAARPASASEHRANS